MSQAIEHVPPLNAFIFRGKYLVDDAFESLISRNLDVVYLDGLQLDRLHVSLGLKAAFPRIDEVFTDNRSKILLIDFAYYILQGNDLEDGFVVVPINQQCNDIRAKNLVLLPGHDRKLYRGTDVVPRDGLSIGERRFLPRSVTILKLANDHEYKFKVTNAKQRQVVGFEVSTCERVFTEKIVPLLVANDPDYHVNDAAYINMCSSYFVAFPGEAVTEIPQRGPRKKPSAWTLWRRAACVNVRRVKRL